MALGGGTGAGGCASRERVPLLVVGGTVGRAGWLELMVLDVGERWQVSTRKGDVEKWNWDGVKKGGENTRRQQSTF